MVHSRMSSLLHVDTDHPDDDEEDEEDAGDNENGSDEEGYSEGDEGRYDELEDSSSQGPAPLSFTIPDESELVLLCLDYLRDLRRSYRSHPGALQTTEGLNAEYITLACWALTRALEAPPALNITDERCAEEGNDAWFDTTKQSLEHVVHPKYSQQVCHRPKLHYQQKNQLPSIQEMEDEFLYRGPQQHLEQQQHSSSEPSDDSSSLYEYDDAHPSNAHRMYPLQGLASGPDLPGPLTMGELVAAGLVALNARTRRQAEQVFCQGPLFQTYLEALHHKGFFDISPKVPPYKHTFIQHERHQKVVAKFRLKLALSAMEEEQFQELSHSYLQALNAAEQQRHMRQVRQQQACSVVTNTYNNNTNTSSKNTKNNENRHQQQEDHDEETEREIKLEIADSASQVGTEVSVASYVKRMAFAQRLFSHNDDKTTTTNNTLSTKQNNSNNNPADLEQAERYKNQGNIHMQQKEYQQAADAYTKALKLSPHGPQSHVYFSNRAAALVSLRQFHQAILDSERALSLQPNYSKAHARLGLAHFLLGNYAQAKQAYQIALQYEPNNKSNQAYLLKATQRLGATTTTTTDTSKKQLASIESTPRTNGDSTAGIKKSRKQHSNNTNNKQSSTATEQNVSDLKDAERYKTKGNSLMASRDYEKALEAYSQAISCSSKGTQSHVYYSNRAACLCYLERYTEAQNDSLQAIALVPTYGKAHARLGLSRFFLHDYAGAVAAYTRALEYDPDNAASQSYLAKAKAKLVATQQHQHNSTDTISHSHTTPSSPLALELSRSTATKIEKAATSPRSSPIASSTNIPDMSARRMLYDENLRTMATKAMANPSPQDLLNDPVMHALSKKAMANMRK